MVMSMSLNISIALVLLQLLLVVCESSLDTDIRCLKAIKSSLQDPYGYLNSSWIFDHHAQGFLCKFVGVDCWHPDESKVLNLRLRGMGITGHFPTGIQYCTSLTGLDLSQNSISGSIPSDIHTLAPFLTTLDLSYNHISGHIPKNIANMTYLNVLKLDHNQLTGTLPTELALLTRIIIFDVSNNLLSGPVPEFIRGVMVNKSYANNPLLCGGPLDPCRVQKSSPSGDSFRLGFGIGYAISLGLVVLCFSFSSLQHQGKKAVVIFSMMQKERRRRKEDGHQLVHFPSLKHNKEIPQLEKFVSKMSFQELSKAVNGFSDLNVIGVGRTGTMYKATLPNGWFLAVKRLHSHEQFESQFVSELLALSRVRHHNLIPLLGFCYENKERLLVYKHMRNGSLYDQLHQVGPMSKHLPWPLRVKIAAGTARGLAWLHHKCVFRVVHRDISSKAVLLDRFFDPKISNFGSAIVSNHGGEIFVYASESDHSGVLVNGGALESKDVYDFGMVLLELITGQETITRPSSSLHPTLVELTSGLSSNPWIFNDAVDQSVMGQGFDGEILQLLRIASDCVNPVPYERPTMLMVYERVANIGSRHGIPLDYTMLLQPRRG